MRRKTRRLIDILNEIDPRFTFIVDGVLNLKEIKQTPYLDLSKLGPITLEGIELFTNVWHLKCNYNSLKRLPNLPESITKLECIGNNLTSIKDLPKNLRKLDCSDNNLTSIQIPDSTVYLNCRKNYLTKLPKLPPKLEELNCQFNLVKTLPNLPKSLIGVYCNGNKLEKAQSLNLENKHTAKGHPAAPFLKLNVNNRLIETGFNSVIVYSRKFGKEKSLIDILGEINSTYVIGNKINEEAVKWVNKLDVSCKGLTNLKGIECFKALRRLDCSYNKLKSLPNLPPLLSELKCNNNQLTKIPDLVVHCWYLDCSNNKLNSLPTLTDSITQIYCSNNKLKKLPLLTNYLFKLDCSFNLIRKLPELPERLRYLNCSNNQLKEVPILPDEFDIKNLIK